MVRDADQQNYPYLKRFTFEPTTKKQSFIGENDKSELIALSDAPGARFEVTMGGDDAFRGSFIITAPEFIAVKSLRAKGKRITTFNVESIVETTPLEIEENELQDTEVNIDNDLIDSDTETDETKSEDEVRDEITGQQRIF